MGADGFDNLASGRHDAECRESSTVDYDLPIHKYFVLGVTTVDHIDVDPEVASELRRHPDGVETRQSVRAVANDNPRHFGPPLLMTIVRLHRLKQAFVPRLDARYARSLHLRQEVQGRRGILVWPVPH